MIALIVVGLAALLLSPRDMLIAFIVFGQGHFIAAYYYQWRAGKLTKVWLTYYIVGATILFTLAYMTQAFEIIALVTMIVFLLHHFQDEVLLFGKERSLIRTLEQLGPVLMFTALTADAIFGTGTAVPTGVAVLVLAVVYLGCVLLKGYRPDSLSAYLALVTAGLLYLAFSHTNLHIFVLSGILILTHYVCWYVHFYYRFRHDEARVTSYVRDMVVINALAVAAFWFFRTTPLLTPLFIAFFAPIYFYIWTILHIVSSIRLSDYRDSIRWR